MRLLFIHEVNYETKVIFEIQEFPELLALRGHEVDFLHFPERVGLRKSSIRTKVKKISGRVYSDAKIDLITPPNFGGSFIDRLISTITIIPVLWHLISRKKYDAVVLYSVPTSGWQAALIGKIKGVPVVFRALDVSHLLRRGLTEKIVRIAEKIVYRNATLISVNNEALGNYCQQESKKLLDFKVDLPPLDFSHFLVENRQEVNLREKYKLLPTDYVIMFMGTFYEFSGIPEVIQSLDGTKNGEIKLVLVGGGKQEEKLRELVKSKNLESKVIFTGVIPYQDLPQILKIANLTFNSFKPQLISNVAFPHKVLQYLAAGIPTVSTKLTGLYSFLGNEAGVQWVNSPEDIVEAASKIKVMSPQDLNQLIETGQLFIKSKFDQNKILNEFENTIKQAIECHLNG